LKLRQPESSCNRDWILFVWVAKQPQRRRLCREFVAGKDTELGEAPQRISRRPVVCIVAVGSAVGWNSKQTGDQLACIDSCASGSQFRRIGFERPPKFHDLSRGSINDILDTCWQFGQEGAKRRIVEPGRRQHIFYPRFTRELKGYLGLFSQRFLQ
jgi:hypothetical protein